MSIQVLLPSSVELGKEKIILSLGQRDLSCALEKKIITTCLIKGFKKSQARFCKLAFTKHLYFICSSLCQPHSQASLRFCYFLPGNSRFCVSMFSRACATQGLCDLLPNYQFQNTFQSSSYLNYWKKFSIIIPSELLKNCASPFLSCHSTWILVCPFSPCSSQGWVLL